MILVSLLTFHELFQVSCGCKTDCVSSRCNCKKSGVKCNQLCKQCKGTTCTNASVIGGGFEFSSEFDDDDYAEDDESDYGDALLEAECFSDDEEFHTAQLVDKEQLNKDDTGELDLDESEDYL